MYFEVGADPAQAVRDGDPHVPRDRSDDLDAFAHVFTKENILRSIKKTGKFTLTYRMLIDNRPVYYNMKATMMENDDNHLIIGVNNVDAQMKNQEEYECIFLD